MHNYFIIEDIDGEEFTVCEHSLTKEEADRLMSEYYYPLMDEHPEYPISYFIVKME